MGVDDGKRDGEISMEELKARCAEVLEELRRNRKNSPEVVNPLPYPRGGGQDGGIRAQELPIRVQEHLIHVREPQYRPPEPIQVQEVQFWQQKSPIRPQETQFQYRGSYSNPPTAMMAATAERDPRIDNRQVNYLANDFRDMQRKSKTEFNGSSNHCGYGRELIATSIFIQILEMGMITQ